MALSEKINITVYKTISVFIVFNAVCFSNIFFRAKSFHKAMELIKDSITNFFPVDYLSGFIAPLAVGGHQIEEFNFLITLFITVIVLLFERIINLLAKTERFNIYYVVGFLLLIMMFGVFNSGVRFIYMQF